VAFASDMPQKNVLWFRARRPQSFGAAIKTLRENSGQNQSEFAERASTSRATISRIEGNGQVSLGTAMAAVNELGYEIVIVPRGAVITIEGRLDG
jgi:transcriptional regulator with XRE-family HTH domain